MDRKQPGSAREVQQKTTHFYWRQSDLTKEDPIHWRQSDLKQKEGYLTKLEKKNSLKFSKGPHWVVEAKQDEEKEMKANDTRKGNVTKNKYPV